MNDNLKKELEQAYFEDTILDMVLDIDGMTIKDRGTIDLLPQDNNGFYLLVTGDDEIHFTEDQVVDLVIVG